MLQEKRAIWAALAQLSLLEALRRKDLYVGIILSIVMIGMAVVGTLLGVHGMESFLKDVTLTVVGGLSSVVTVLFAARRLPEEVERRTIYPLLARPVSRTDYLIGQFLGTYAVGLLALGLFALVGRGLLACVSVNVCWDYLQFLLLHALALAVLGVLTMTLSLVFPASIAATISLLLSCGTAGLSQATLLFQEGSALQRFVAAMVQTSYYLIPRLDLFDRAGKSSAAQHLLPAVMIVNLVIYAAICVFLLGIVGVWRFERRAL